MQIFLFYLYYEIVALDDGSEHDGSKVIESIA